MGNKKKQKERVIGREMKIQKDREKYKIVFPLLYVCRIDYSMPE